ncbi:MAG: phosphoribosylamine--glycine ligase [Anaerovoracaceae bacterium]|jgi:phosphoribosylamine--glycine ligase
MTKISVLVSGGGTDFQSIIDNIENGNIPDAEIVQVISSKEDAYALERAKKHNIPGKFIGKGNYPDMGKRTEAILAALDGADTDLVVLAGYISIVQPEIIKKYKNRIINIHPALIPKYCGKGFYGIRVHQAVLKGGEKESGATVHFVDEGVDTGRIILQKKVPVLEGDTPEDLAARVLEIEHQILPEAVRMFCTGELGKKILVVGGGGREHAIVWKLAQSYKVGRIYCAPGNPGIAEQATCVPIGAEDLEEIRDFCVEKDIDMAVIGPEVPLSMGITDLLNEAGVKVFGPDKSCSRLEGSKSFTKSFLMRHNIPTAKYKEYTDADSLRKDIGIFGYPMVLKADGLAAGKGVVLAENAEEAEAAIHEMMEEHKFGGAADKVIVEECLRGVEASMLCFVDGKTIVPMESAQDYKRIYDDDKGPNTGGMGSYSPSLLFNEELEKQIREQILDPTINGFIEDGLDFHGVLFIGLMLSEDGPKVIEFNNRFGDPETQSVLMRLDSDLEEIFEACIDGTLADTEIKWSGRRAVCVVLASGGYPGSYEKGKVISGLGDVDDDIVVFHAGTALKDGKIVTSGGRVLGVTATGKTNDEARARAFDNVKRISFDGMYYRNDIGKVNRH